MKTQIKVDEELCRKNPEYPLVLLCNMAKEGMSFSSRYKLKIEGDESKTINGVVEFVGMSSVNVLDDEDADMYYIEAERESVNSVVEYLREQFPGAKFRGVIRGISTTTYHGEREYKIPWRRYEKMSKLPEIIKEDTGKCLFEMCSFIDSIVNKGELNVYDIELNQNGITLKPTSFVEEGTFILEDPKTAIKYCLDAGYIAPEWDDDDDYTRTHCCKLEKLVDGFDPKQIRERNYHALVIRLPRHYQVPIGNVIASLKVTYKEDWKAAESCFYPRDEGKLEIKGEMDPLFERICEFVRG